MATKTARKRKRPRASSKSAERRLKTVVEHLTTGHRRPNFLAMKEKADRLAVSLFDGGLEAAGFEFAATGRNWVFGRTNREKKYEERYLLEPGFDLYEQPQLSLGLEIFFADLPSPPGQPNEWRPRIYHLMGSPWSLFLEEEISWKSASLDAHRARQNELIPVVERVSAIVEKHAETLRLRAAAANGFPDSVAELLHRGISPNGGATPGDTPLMAAAYSLSYECLKILLEAGADPSETRGARTARGAVCAADLRDYETILSENGQRMDDLLVEYIEKKRKAKL